MFLLCSLGDRRPYFECNPLFASTYQCTYYCCFPGSIKVEAIAIKAEPEPQEEEGWESPCVEIHIDPPDVNNKLSERTDRNIQTAGKTDFCLLKLSIRALRIFAFLSKNKKELENECWRVSLSKSLANLKSYFL